VSRSRVANAREFDRLRDRAHRHRRILVPLAVGAGLGAVGLALFLPSTARAEDKGSQPTGERPSSDVPQLPKLKGRAQAERYLIEAEKVSKIDGIATFGLAASKRESGWNNMAVNNSEKEAAAACRAYDYQKTRAIEDSPYNDPEYFCWGTGGWFGQMPAYAVARKPFTDLNPIWAVHDPATSTAMFVASKESLIRRFFPKIPPEHRNWLAVRRSMASLKTFYDYEEEGERAKAVRKRFAENLKQIGVDPSFMYEHPSVSGYPGNQAVWDALRELETTKAAA